MEKIIYVTFILIAQNLSQTNNIQIIETVWAIFVGSIILFNNLLYLPAIIKKKSTDMMVWIIMNYFL